jgi:hypothetical protein
VINGGKDSSCTPDGPSVSAWEGLHIEELILRTLDLHVPMLTGVNGVQNRSAISHKPTLVFSKRHGA